MKKISKKLTSDSIIQIINPKEEPKPVKFKRGPKKRDESGNILNKDGSISKLNEIGSKGGKGAEALRKWRENQKKLKETKAPPVEEESSDDEVEFEIESVEVKKVEPKVIEKEVEKIVEKEVIKEVPVEVEVIKPDLLVVKENEELREKNKKLEDSFRFNEHLSRINNMSRITSIKF
jgi:hypothetical protein